MSALPVAKWQGTLKIGNRDFECHVLEDEARILSQRGVMLALTGNDEPPRKFLGSKALKGLLPKDFLPRNSRRFLIEKNNTEAIGIEASGFVEICQALVAALAEGRLTGEAQLRAGSAAAIVLGACATVGITALVDEATGFQHARAKDALQLKLEAYIAKETRDWELMFQRRYYDELDRLSGYKRTHRNRNPSIYAVVTDKIYEVADPDVAEHLRIVIPSPKRGGPKRHQQLTEFGRAKLRDTLLEQFGVMSACLTLREYNGYLDDRLSKQQRLALRPRRAAS